MNACPICSLTYGERQRFCTRCGARLFQKDKPEIEWLTPTSPMD